MDNIITIRNNRFVIPVKSEYRDKINEANKQIQMLDGEIDKGLQEVEDINSQISTVQNEINTLTSELTELQNSIKVKEKELEDKKQLLEDRMVAMYMAGETTYLDVLLSGGFLDFVSNYYLVTQIVEYDTNLINEVEQIKITLENEKAQVETKKQEKQEKQDYLKRLKSEKQSSVNKLTTEQKELQTKVDSWDVKMKELEEAERKAASSGNSNYAYDGGTLQWPVPASRTISSNYGYRLHPIYKTYRLHSGVDIAASSGTSIVAAEDGTVLLSSYGYNGGYGNYVVIDHGTKNGVRYTTVYAHLKSVSVKKGDAVIKGQKIGYMGSTGWSTGTHLHFEIRRNNVQINAMQYYPELKGTAIYLSYNRWISYPFGNEAKYQI